MTRTASKSKSSLRVLVGGVDLTQQEQRLTEEQLESVFSASLLPKTLVFTQEDLLGLLQVCGGVEATCFVEGASCSDHLRNTYQVLGAASGPARGRCSTLKVLYGFLGL